MSKTVFKPSFCRSFLNTKLKIILFVCILVTIQFMLFSQFLLHQLKGNNCYNKDGVLDNVRTSSETNIRLVTTGPTTIKPTDDFRLVTTGPTTIKPTDDFRLVTTGPTTIKPTDDFRLVTTGPTTIKPTDDFRLVTTGPTTIKPTDDFRLVTTGPTTIKPTDDFNSSSRMTRFQISQSTTQTHPEKKEEEEIPFSKFQFPLNIDFRKLVEEYLEKGYSDIPPINTYKYPYISTASHKCKSNSTIYLLLIVKSAAAHFGFRMNIRNTWGNESYGNSFGMKTVFLLGKHKSASVQSKIHNESLQFRDVIQIDFLDNYYNNTLKTTGGYRWISQYCNNSKFVLAVDDDYFVAPKRIAKFLSNLSHSDAEGLFMGHRGSDYVPRDKLDRWHIPIKDYPFHLYPPFLSGGAILMSMRMAMEISIGISYTKSYKYDDVYIGIVLYKLGRKLIENKYMMIRRFNLMVPQEVRHVLAAHNYRYDLKLRWKEHLLYLNSFNNSIHKKNNTSEPLYNKQPGS